MISRLVTMLRRAVAVPHITAQLAELSCVADRLMTVQADILAMMKDRATPCDGGLHDLRVETAALHATLRTVARQQQEPPSGRQADVSAIPDAAAVRSGTVVAGPANQRAPRRRLMRARPLGRPALVRTASSGPADHQKELDACRTIEARCAFVMGFARSSTTVTAQVINGDPRAFMMGEANFHLPRPGCFRDAYNTQHAAYGSQVTKFTYAPDFLGRAGAAWWEYLLAASSKYTLVGDKLAFSSHLLSASDRATTMSFYEARFFASRYVFLFRDPIQTVLSARLLFNLQDIASVETEIGAWLETVMLWADWVRVFPHTLTLMAGELHPDSADRIGDFLGLKLSGARGLFNQAERQHHAEGDLPPELARCRAELQAVYDAIRDAIAYGQGVTQPAAGQGGEGVAATQRGPSPGFLHAPYPVGHAWTLARSLHDRLRGTECS